MLIYAIQKNKGRELDSFNEFVLNNFWIFQNTKPMHDLRFSGVCAKFAPNIFFKQFLHFIISIASPMCALHINLLW